MSIVSYIAPVVFFYMVRAGYRKYKSVRNKVNVDIVKLKSKFASKDIPPVGNIIDKAKADVENAANALRSSGSANKQNQKTT